MMATAAAAALLMTAAAVWRQRPPGAGRLCTGMLAGAVYFVVVSDTRFDVLRPLAWLGPLAFNRAVHAGFGDPSRPVWQDIALALASALLGVWLPRGFDLLALGLFAEAPLRVYRDAAGDLDSRRRLRRFWFLGLGGAVGLVVSLAAMVGSGAAAAQLAGAATLLLCLAAAGRPWPTEPVAVPAAEPAGLDTQERQQLARLRALMADQQVYRDPQLTLSRLAQRLDLPEHRLRRLIHDGEGHGHFSSYLNAWRIAAVKAALGDPARDGDTVL
ncbi:MAG: AraC family transcriptional regulator, partial [Burkholderiales bacterium]